MLERRTPRDDEGETVSYSGPCLAELLAASGENHALAAVDSVESTVVIPGSRPSSLPVAPRAERAPLPDHASGSFGAVAYTVALPSVADSDLSRRGLARPGVALLLASLGLLIGLFVGTTIATDAPRSGRALAAQSQAQTPPTTQPRERLADTTPLVSPTHQKNATKRRGRVVVGTAPPIAHAPVPTPTPSPPAVEAGTDAQQLEDRRLLLAAEAERSF